MSNGAGVDGGGGGRWGRGVEAGSVESLPKTGFTARRLVCPSISMSVGQFVTI